MSRKVT